MNGFFKLAVIQADILFEDAGANLNRYRDMLKGMTVHPDLIVFPETFATGFSVNPEQHAEQMTGESVSWLRQMAVDMDALMAGSLIIEENHRYFNRFLLVDPQGEVRYYDKRHLFSMGNEESHYQAGCERKIFQTGEWRICPQICYDLRFPVWSRNRSDYEVLIYVANWPEPRRDVWKTLLRARAVENLSYCIGVNRVGRDEKGIYYAGESMIVNGKGEILNKVTADSECIILSELSLPDLVKLRNDFPAHRDADAFRLE
ncbi:MAG: amidohydrolase [Bacteroidales bacterium]|nr:amidohydrolase [Bacteroidales bacterium]